MKFLSCSATVMSKLKKTQAQICLMSQAQTCLMSQAQTCLMYQGHVPIPIKWLLEN